MTMQYTSYRNVSPKRRYLPYTCPERRSPRNVRQENRYRSTADAVSFSSDTAAAVSRTVFLQRNIFQ